MTHLAASDADPSTQPLRGVCDSDFKGMARGAIVLGERGVNQEQRQQLSFMRLRQPSESELAQRFAPYSCDRALTFDMRGGRQQAKLAVGRPLDRQVRAADVAEAATGSAGQLTQPKAAPNSDYAKSV